ncbi:MAG: tRNA (adenosine(37)-N6)-threonylcarbamoyltransferase complex ATPase subunit type 1 TsaE [Clostridia bacterium]
MLKIVSNNHAQTMKLGEILATYLTSEDVVILSGELGAGKTVLVRGIVKGYSGDEDLVRSPSYIYINTYKNGKTVHHIDFYLLNNYEQALDTGFEDLLNEDLCLIEWGEKFEQLNDNSFWKVIIKYDGVNKRQIELIAPESRKETLEEIESKWPF